MFQLLPFVFLFPIILNITVGAEGSEAFQGRVVTEAVSLHKLLAAFRLSYSNYHMSPLWKKGGQPCIAYTHPQPYVFFHR